MENCTSILLVIFLRDQTFEVSFQCTEEKLMDARQHLLLYISEHFFIILHIAVIVSLWTKLKANQTEFIALMKSLKTFLTASQDVKYKEHPYFLWAVCLALGNDYALLLDKLFRSEAIKELLRERENAFR